MSVLKMWICWFTQYPPKLWGAWNIGCLTIIFTTFWSFPLNYQYINLKFAQVFTFWGISATFSMLMILFWSWLLICCIVCLQQNFITFHLQHVVNMLQKMATQVTYTILVLQAQNSWHKFYVDKMCFTYGSTR